MSIEFLKKYCTFTAPNEVYLLECLTRTKETDTRFFSRRVLTCEDDIKKGYSELRTLAEANGTGVYRIYVSVNSRDTVKALANLQKKLIDISVLAASKNEDGLNMSKRIASLWKKELDQSSCRFVKRFLIDVDEPNIGDRLTVLTYARKMTSIYASQKTPNGFAIVIDACDTREFLDKMNELGYNVEIKKDSLLFIERFKVN